MTSNLSSYRTSRMSSVYRFIERSNTMVNATIRFSDLVVMEISFDETGYGADDTIGKLYYGDEEVLDIVLKEQNSGEGEGDE